MTAWIVTASLVVILLIGFFLVVAYFFKIAITRSKFVPNVGDDKFTGEESPWQKSTKKGQMLMSELTKEEILKKSFDGLLLHATFYPAKVATNRTILAIHGFKSDSHGEYSLFIRFYHDQGFNMLIPDCRAHGQSEGKYIGFGNLDRHDCVMWAKYLADRFGEDSKIMLQGVSMGAATVLSASAEELPRQVLGAVSDCAFTSAWDQFVRELKRSYHLPAFPILHLCECICKLKAGYGFRENSPIEQVAKAGIPILFVHGQKDDFVPFEMLQRLYDTCNTKKMRLAVPNAGHAQSMLIAPELYEKAILQFMGSIGF